MHSDIEFWAFWENEFIFLNSLNLKIIGMYLHRVQEDRLCMSILYNYKIFITILDI